MHKKNILVTGANAGIGYETAKQLAADGHHVLLHARNPEKAQQAKTQILDKHPEAHITPVSADLGQLSEIAQMAKVIQEQLPHLDVLVNNAGVWNSMLELSEEGVEKTLAINHLAYFYLGHLLYPLLAKAPQGGRLVCVASDSHQQIKGMFWENLNLTNNYHGLRSYAQSKLANVLFVYEFARRCPAHVASYAIQPGLVQTDIGLKGNTWLHRLAWKVRRQMKGHKTPAQGAATSIFLATQPDVQNQTGLYWDNCQPKKSYSSSNDEEEARRLWQWSCEVCGIKDFFA